MKLTLLSWRITIPVLVAVLWLCAPVHAQLIPAANRTDMAFDSLRCVLYIANGTELVRYSVKDQALLPPIALGTDLKGMAISPGGATLAVADNAVAGTENFVHLVDLETGAASTVLFTLAFGEGGTYSVAYAGDGSLLVSSEYVGSGNVPLRQYDPGSGTTTMLAMIRQRSMLAASADGTVVGFEESNSSAGPFGRYRTSDGNILAGPGTAAFNYEIGVSRTGSQYAFPTFSGCFVYDGAFNPVTLLGGSGTNHPIGAVYHPTSDIVYFAWSGTTEIRALDTSTFALLNSYNTGTTFNHPGNNAFVEGRLKIAPDGSKLFCTVDNGVLLITLDNCQPQGLADAGVVDADQVLAVLTTPAGSSVLDNDVDCDMGAVLTVTAFDAVSTLGAAVAMNPDGTFTYNPVPSATLQALGAGNSLDDTFTYTVSDGTDSATGTVTVTVNGYDPAALPVAGNNVLLILAAAMVIAARSALGVAIRSRPRRG